MTFKEVVFIVVFRSSYRLHSLLLLLVVSFGVGIHVYWFLLYFEACALRFGTIG